jgi:hypothetical protein
MLSPLMPSWERLHPARVRGVAYVASTLAVAVPFLVDVLLSPAVSAPHSPAPLSMVAVNAGVDTALVVAAMAILGRFYGLGLGAVLVVANIALQSWQFTAGFALRRYAADVAPLVPGQDHVALIAVLLGLCSLFAWSWTGGQGFAQSLRGSRL